MNRNLLVTMTVVAMTILTHGQGQQGGRGGAPAGARAGGPALPPLMQTAPKPAIPNVKAVRSCESLASVMLLSKGGEGLA